ncbi:hypothetical protein [Sphingobacterium faecium]|uniref:hypothetical protein n=1 Tax=Sphingobacterium faecium TaxID=34087 RepID=UPI0032084857
MMIDSAILMQETAYKPNIFLIDENDQPYTLSSDKFRNKFKAISLYKKQNRKQLKKGINAWKILPVLTGNKLTIDIIDFIITYNNNNYTFGNGGGATVVFEYNCDIGKWVLVNTKWLGT